MNPCVFAKRTQLGGRSGLSNGIGFHCGAAVVPPPPWPCHSRGNSGWKRAEASRLPFLALLFFAVCLGMGNPAPAASAPKPKDPVSWDILLPALGLATNDLPWATGDAQIFISRLRLNMEQSRGSGGDNLLDRGVDTNAVAQLWKEMANQQRQWDRLIGQLVTNLNTVDAADREFVRKLQKEIVVEKQSITNMEQRLEAQIADVRANLSQLQSAFPSGAGATMKTEGKAALFGTMALAGVLVLFVAGGVAAWKYLRPLRVLRKTAWQLDPSDPESLLIRMVGALNPAKDGSIARRVADLEERLKEQAQSPPKFARTEQSGCAPAPLSARLSALNPPAASVVAYPSDYDELKRRVAGLETAVRVSAEKLASQPPTPAKGLAPARPDARLVEPTLASIPLAATPAPTVVAIKDPLPAVLFDPDLRARIGQCFVQFCQANRSYLDLEDFQVVLGQAVAGATVQMAYRPYSSMEACFYAEAPQTAYSRAWVVFAGTGLYLLPWAISADEFDTVRECFVLSPGTMPQNLAECLPAVLVVEGKRWFVPGEHQGRLSQQPVEPPRTKRDAGLEAPATPTSNRRSSGVGATFGQAEQPQSGLPPTVRASAEWTAANQQASLGVVDLLAKTSQRPPKAPKLGKAMEASAAESELGLPERIGLCFVKFCRTRQSEYPLGGFQQMLVEHFPRASVKPVWRNAGHSEPYVSENKTANPHRGWLVNLGEDHFLLPCPVRSDKFEIGTLFDGGDTVTPANIERCRPCGLRGSADRWDVVPAQKGQLSQPPVEKPSLRPEKEPLADPHASVPEPGAREKIGLCFVKFCRGEHTVYVAEEFEKDLCEVLKGAKVQVGYRFGFAQEVHFYKEQPKSTYAQAWIVTLGDDLFLLPWAMSATDFDTVIACFEMLPGTMPKNLKHCRPAMLLLEGRRWGVVEQGTLSTQPDEKLQRWWLADQEARQPKPQAVPKPLPAVAPVAVVASQTLDVPTTTTVGEAFVQFCKMAVVDVVAPPFDSFLKELGKRFPGACLSGGETQVGSESSVTVWQVLSGRAGLAKKGWLLPAIKTLNEFHLFGDMFTPEGGPTPETVRQVIPAEINLEYRGVEQTWVPASPGKVSTKKPEPVAVSGGVVLGTHHSAAIAATQSSATPWEAEVMAAVGEAFVKACEKIAKRPERFKSKHDFLSALRNCLTKYSPMIQPVDAVLVVGPATSTRLRLAAPEGWGDGLLVTVKSTAATVHLVTPKLAAERIPYHPRGAKLCFSLESPYGSEAETLLLGSVTGSVPCRVQRVPKLDEYEVVEPGKITMG